MTLPSPALLVDVAAADRNVARAAEAGIRVRPHFKAHKCTTLLRRQLAAANAEGVTCATAHEAGVLTAADFGDVLVANEVADPVGLAALARAAARGRVTVCVDDQAHVELLVAAGFRGEVLVEVDVGQGRCGLAPGDPEIVALARTIAATEELRLRGLQGYEGHAVLLADAAAREAQVARAAGILATERRRLAEAGLTCELVTGGGTGTLHLAATAGALDEVQAGSYVLMDASYDRLGLGFEQSLWCHTTVLSRRGTRIVLDAGLKALSAEYGMPRGTEAGIEVVSLADEHATATVPAASALAVGDTTRLVPAHVDPTVNLHAVLYAMLPDGTVEPWPVDGRRP